MSTPNKRRDALNDRKGAKKPRKDCSYGVNCYRRNPAHLREYIHAHLDSILDEYSGDGHFPIPSKYGLQKQMILEQLEVMMENKIYEPGNKIVSSSTIEAEPSRSNEQTEQMISSSESRNNTSTTDNNTPTTGNNTPATQNNTTTIQINTPATQSNTVTTNSLNKALAAMRPQNKEISSSSSSNSNISPSTSRSSSNVNTTQNQNSIAQEPNRVDNKDSTYRPVVPPTRQAEQFLKVVRPRGNMAAKHAASAPYHIFYTTISDAKETHDQSYSITFLELLDASLGELKCSLQINFMVEPGWLLAQYYFAGYSQKRLTILYGEDSQDMKTLNEKKPHVDAHYVAMPTPFGKHHTKMMILCYEDGSLRVVVSTANLYSDDWENRTQGLWFSPPCPELPPDAMPHSGDSPTLFKRSLLRYLAHYHRAELAFYTERVKRCDFSHINVFLVASAPGSHFDADWGLARVGALLRQHCCIPAAETHRWPLLAQASSIGSFGKEAKLWLTGDFLHHFTKISTPPKMLAPLPEVKVIYPSLENVQQSHDGLLGGGCLPYAADAHAKQLWLNNYLYQWKATHSKRNRAMPHIKTYTRVSPCHRQAAFYLLTSANVSKAAWGVVNKGNAALRLMSYEAGVLFMPKLVIGEDFFPLEAGAKNRLIIPYDIPPTKYTSDMSPWVSDYLMK